MGRREVIFALALPTVQSPKFRALVLYENGGHHVEYSKRAKVWLDELAAKRGFAIDYIQNTDTINDDSLGQYQLFIQLDYSPYAWKDKAVTAFQRYITEGRGGWIGFHHASLLGEFDGYKMWDWYSNFMGGIRWKDYIATFAQAEVHVEDRKHPVMRGIPPIFTSRPKNGTRTTRARGRMCTSSRASMNRLISRTQKSKWAIIP